MPTHKESDSRYVELRPAADEGKGAPSLSYIMLLAAVALTSGMANGYNGTSLEGVIPRLQHFDMLKDPVEMGMLEGAMSVGGLLGSLACTELAYALSRRVLVIIGEAAIAVGVIGFSCVGPFATTPLLLTTRLLTGLGVGVCGLAKPLLVSELAPPSHRGLLVSFFAVGQSLGMNLFFLVDWLLPGAETSWAWRVLAALGATPAFVVMALACAFQSTRDREYWDVAYADAGKSKGADAGAPRMLVRMLTVEPPTVRRNFGLIVAMMIGYNLSGTLVISNYASDLLADPTRKLPIIVGLVQLCGLVTGASLVDRLGRRPLLLCSCFLTVVGLLSIAFLLGVLHAVPAESATALWTLLLLMVVVEFAVGAGLNPVKNVLSAELMPNMYRSLGMSLGNAAGWLLALASLFLYPVISAAVGGAAPQFAFFAFVVACLGALLAWQLPETKGMNFEGEEATSTSSVSADGTVSRA